MMIKKLITTTVLIASLFVSSQNSKDSLLQIIGKKTIDTNVVKAYIALSKIEMQTDLTQSENYLKKAIELSEANKYYKQGGDAYMNIAILHFSSGKLDAASASFMKAHDIYMKGKQSHRAARAINNAGFVYYNQGDLPKALEYYQKALKEFEISKDYEAISSAITNISAIYYSFENYRKMLEYFNVGLKVFQEKKDTINIGVMYASMYLPYYEMKIKDSALICLQLAEKQYILAKSEKNLNFLYDNYGNYYLEFNDLVKAEEYINKSLEISAKISDFKQLSFNYNSLGNLAMKKHDYKGALAYFKQSMELQQKLNLKTYMVKKYFSMGLACDSLKDYKNAIVYYSECLKLAQASGQKDVSKGAYNGLSFAYRNIGDYKKALQNFELYTMEKDSILSEESMKSVNELSTKYETEKKQLQIANLEKEKQLQDTELKSSRLQRIALSVGILFMLLFVVIVVRSYKQKQKANELLVEKNNLIEQQHKEVMHQKEIVEEKQKEILDSIQYAKRIQSSLLAHTDFLNENIPHNFVLYKPKDIVSGDFYWATKRDHLFYLAVCDSTGHGVPGAFMSLLNIGFLSEAINEKNITEPHLVFNYVRQRLIDSISKEGQKDGFDGTLICIDQKTKKITYATANNAPIIIRNNEILEQPKDKMPVGKGERTESFTTHEIVLQPNDTLYLYTDGYADQFGGPKGKKFLYKRLNELIKSLNTDDIYKRGDKLNLAFEEWRGNLEQVDDVLIIGIRL